MGENSGNEYHIGSSLTESGACRVSSLSDAPGLLGAASSGRVDGDMIWESLGLSRAVHLVCTYRHHS